MRGTYVVLLTELLGQGSAHDVAADTRGGLEVRLAGLAPRGVEGCETAIIVSIYQAQSSYRTSTQNVLFCTLAIVMDVVARTGRSGGLGVGC